MLSDNSWRPETTGNDLRVTPRGSRCLAGHQSKWIYSETRARGDPIDKGDTFFRPRIESEVLSNDVT